MTPTSRLSALLTPAALAAAFAVAPATNAATTIIDFSGTQYDSFTEVINGNLMSVSNNALIISSPSSAAGVTNYENAFPSAGISEFTVSADVSFGTMATSALNGNSIGFVTNLSALSDGTGFVTIFRVRNDGTNRQADMRVFTITSTGTLGGSPVATATLNTAALSAAFASNTFYKFQLEVDTSTPGTIGFAGSILNSTNSSIIGTFSALSASYAGSSEPTFVGLRLGTQGNTITTVDNFTLTSAIPEPSAFAAFAGLATLGFAASRRRRAA